MKIENIENRVASLHEKTDKKYKYYTNKKFKTGIIIITEFLPMIKS